MADWETVTILKKKPPKASAMKSEQAINAARRQGVAIDTQTKLHCQQTFPPEYLRRLQGEDEDALKTALDGGAGTNKQHVTTKNTAKLDRETEELKHEKIPLDLGKLIQQGRQAKGWSQKELATKVNEKPQVINDYEAGRGIPNQMVIGKIERAIGIKLRGKDRGTATQPPGTKK